MRSRSEAAMDRFWTQPFVIATLVLAFVMAYAVTTPKSQPYPQINSTLAR